jgi:hypothetical protein
MLELLDDPYGLVVKQALEVLCMRPDRSAVERLARLVEEDDRSISFGLRGSRPLQQSGPSPHPRPPRMCFVACTAPAQ